MVLNKDIDAIIISKIAEKERIESIDPLNVSLGAISSIGHIAAQVRKSKSPVAYLTPLFMQVTLLARIANVNAAAILDSEQYKESGLCVDHLKISIPLLSLAVVNLTNAAHDIKNIMEKSSKDEEDKSVVENSVNNATQDIFMILKAMDEIANHHNSSIAKVQANVLKHINQLVSLI